MDLNYPLKIQLVYWKKLSIIGLHCKYVKIYKSAISVTLKYNICL